MRLVFIALAAIALTGCAATRTTNPADPLESFNRSVYKFNDVVDKSIAKPVAQGYNTVIPLPARTMVSNFFSNLDDLVVTANDLLQFKFVQAFSDGGRMLINTTVGVFGLVDVAAQAGYEKHKEDFGQTLGYWGVGSGPYLMLPLLGPSTFRDSIGIYADSKPSLLWHVNHIRTRNQLYLTRAINGRAQLLDEEKVLDEAAIDRYAFIRDTYLLHRQSLIYDGNPPREKFEEEENGFEYQPAPLPLAPSSLNTTPSNGHGEFHDNGHGNNAAPDNETRHARFPHPPLPPQAGEGGNDSLREFHDNDGRPRVSAAAEPHAVSHSTHRLWVSNAP